MSHRDPHASLKSEVLKNTNSAGAVISLVKGQWSKEDIAYSLHDSPNSWSTAGIQLTDFLNFLGFERGRCSFNAQQECFFKWVNQDFDLDKFSEKLNQAFSNLKDAQRDLERCGFFFNQPEGWGYFFGKRPSQRNIDFSMTGDGHTGAARRDMKVSEDNYFYYKFTWLETSSEKGWVIHYRPKHFPISSEIESVFKFLDLQTFPDCPEFEFEQCYWKSIKYIAEGRSMFDGNTNAAHSWFDSHATQFSSGIQKLLAANKEIEESGFIFLPFPKPQERLNTDIERRIQRPKSGNVTQKNPGFDVAISFAGTERQLAEQLATKVRDAGYSVFYDDFYQEYLWGKNLVDTFDEIFRKQSRYCVIFISREYKERLWTNHERQSAQARALQEKGKDYILPLKVEDEELPGMPPTVGYLSIDLGIDKIADLLIKKLKKV